MNGGPISRTRPWTIVAAFLARLSTETINYKALYLWTAGVPVKRQIFSRPGGDRGRPLVVPVARRRAAAVHFLARLQRRRRLTRCSSSRAERDARAPAPRSCRRARGRFCSSLPGSKSHIFIAQFQSILRLCSRPSTIQSLRCIRWRPRLRLILRPTSPPPVRRDARLTLTGWCSPVSGLLEFCSGLLLPFPDRTIVRALPEAPLAASRACRRQGNPVRTLNVRRRYEGRSRGSASGLCSALACGPERTDSEA